MFRVINGMGSSGSVQVGQTWHTIAPRASADFDTRPVRMSEGMRVIMVPGNAPAAPAPTQEAALPMGGRVGHYLRSGGIPIRDKSAPRPPKVTDSISPSLAKSDKKGSGSPE